MSGPAWHEGRMVCVDLETTGVDVHADRIVTAAVVHLKPGERPRTLTWVIDPGIEIPASASDIHGWTNAKIAAHRDHRGGPMTAAGALFEIAGQVALAVSSRVPLVAFNAAFDLSMLEAECVRHDVDPLTARLPKGLTGVIDPFVIDKHYSRRRGSRKLIDQCGHYQVMHTGAHDAGADALATLRLVARQVAAYGELRGMSLSKLHQSQVGWRAEQCESLRKYFDSKGIDHDGVPGEWPLIPAPVGAVAS